MAIPQSKNSMKLVLYMILKLLSRPVVCANFQGLQTNTIFQLVELLKATIKFKIEYPRAVRSVFLDTREQLSSISYTAVQSAHPVVRVVSPW